MERYAYSASAVLLESLITQYPQSLLYRKALWDLGESYHALKKFDKTLGVYQKIIKKYPANRDIPRIHYQMASIYESQENWQNAVLEYQELLVNHPASTFSFLAQKRLKILKDKAGVVFELSEDDFYNRAVLLGGRRKFWAFAISELEIFIQNFPQSRHIPSALYNMGKIYERKRYSEKALEAYQSVFQKFPNNPLAIESLYRMGYIAWNKNWDEQVINVYNQVLEKYGVNTSPENQNTIRKIYFVLGRIYEKKHDFAKASFNYQQMVEHSPNKHKNAKSLWKTGWAYYLWGKADTAEKYFIELGKTNGYDGIKGRYWAGRIAENQGEKEKSLKLYKSIWDTLPLSYYGVLSYRRMSRTAKTTIPFKTITNVDMSFAIGLSPDAEYHLSRALELYSMGIFKESARELRHCEKLIKNPSFLLFESRLLSKMGKPLQAMQAVLKNKNPFARLSANDKLSRDKLKIVLPLKYRESIWRYSAKNSVSPWFITSIIRQESAFNPLSVSGANAYGLMQIIPQTGMALAAKLGFKDFSRRILFNPEKNIMMGTRYISDLSKKYGGNFIIAAAHYNAGPVVKKWWKNRLSNDVEEFIENVPYKETRNYIKLIVRNFFSYKLIYTQQ